MRQFIDPSIESNVFAVPSPTHKGSINGRRLAPQSFGLRPPTGGADGYTPHNDLPSWEVGLTSVIRLELHLIQISLLILSQSQACRDALFAYQYRS